MMAVKYADGLALGRVERVEQVRDIHQYMVTKSPTNPDLFIKVLLEYFYLLLLHL